MITLTVTETNLHKMMLPVAPATGGSGTWSNNATAGALIAQVTIPCTPAFSYDAFTLNGLVRSGANNSSVRIYRRWLDRQGQVLNHRQGAAFTVSTSPQNQYLAGSGTSEDIAPAQTAYAQFGLMDNNGSAAARTIVCTGSNMTYNINAMDLLVANLERPLFRSVFDTPSPLIQQVASSKFRKGQLSYLCATLDEAKAVEAIYLSNNPVTLRPAALSTNLHLNPLFLGGVGTWSLAGGTHTLTNETNGPNNLPWQKSTVVTQSTSSPVSLAVPSTHKYEVVPNRAYAISAWLGESGFTYAKRCDVRWFDNTATQIGGSIGASNLYGSVTVAGCNWYQVGDVLTAPAGAVSVSVTPIFGAPQAAAIGTYRGVAGIMIERSGVMNPIAIGAQSDSPFYMYSWLGEYNNSPSARTDIMQVNNFAHRAVESVMITSERALNGVHARWIVDVEVREIL